MGWVGVLRYRVTRRKRRAWYRLRRRTAKNGPTNASTPNTPPILSCRSGHSNLAGVLGPYNLIAQDTQVLYL
jgi:hypothetical protein